MATRTIKDVRNTMKYLREHDPEGLTAIEKYDKWAATYKSDLELMEYQSPKLAADIIASNFNGQPEDALVLDVACGPGQLPKWMNKHGFKHFVGIDGSKEMIKLATETGLYKELKEILLGPNPLPFKAGMFDVVVILGALEPTYVPFSILTEMCQVTKPGGLICVSKTNHMFDDGKSTVDLEKELQTLVEKGLWIRIERKKFDKILKKTCLKNNEEAEGYTSGTIHLFRVPSV
ncbi:methyltransferase-like protein 27 [Antennarius striatus]|uniref:methyltransferase-like protein 27 n=1 Tax=Antennarius striatus TaxID=241820 RepID=UPI0035B0DE42